MYRLVKKISAIGQFLLLGNPITAVGLAVRWSIYLLLIAFLGWFNLPQPDVILSISARTQTFSYRVTDKRAASLILMNVQIVQNRLENLEAPQLICARGRMVPENDAIIRYRLLEKGMLSISFEGMKADDNAAKLEKDSGDIITIKALDTVLLDPNNETCPARLPSAIPIWGPGNIGQLRSFGTGVRHEPGELISGQVRITARAVERFFGVIQGAKGLYDAGNVTIPAGAVLRSVVSPNDTEDDLFASDWIGTARPGTSNGLSAFQMDISTESDTVLLYRAGLGPTGKPDTIGASTFVSQTRDPGVLGLQIGLALIMIILQTVATVAQTVEPAQRKPHKPKTDKKKSVATKKSRKRK